MKFIAREHPRVSVERLLSGRGLVNIYRALCAINRGQGALILMAELEVLLHGRLAGHLVESNPGDWRALSAAGTLLSDWGDYEYFQRLTLESDSERRPALLHGPRSRLLPVDQAYGLDVVAFTPWPLRVGEDTPARHEEDQPHTRVVFEEAIHRANAALEAGQDVKSAVQNSLSRLEGAFALALLFEGHDDLLIAARKGAPLAIGYGEGENYLGSDAFALAPFGIEEARRLLERLKIMRLLEGVRGEPAADLTVD